MLQCENPLFFPRISNPRCVESRIGGKLYEMLILATTARTRAAIIKIMRAIDLEEAPGSIMTGIDFPSLRGRGGAVHIGRALSR